MPFPEKTRIIYKKNPLERVICQLKFPPILKIESEIPIDFQDKIRREYPNFIEKSEFKVELPINSSGKASSDLPVHLSSKANNNFEFSSEDGNWTINLTRSFIALSSTNYSRWEEFKEKLANPLKYFVETYSLKYFTRIGLRYIDIINRSELGLSDIGWNELLKPYVIGMLATEDVGLNVIGYESKNEIKLEDKTSTVRIISSLIQESETREVCFLIDSDFFTEEKTKVDDAISKLDFFNTRSSRLIQWCITDRLHQAMEPDTL